MPIYAALGRATNEGARNLVGFKQRHAAAVKRAEAALRVLIKEVSGGNVRYETYPAVPMEEFAALVEEG